MANKSKQEFLFVTVNYNGANHTIKYLESIEKLKKRGFKTKVVVVDNSSSEEDFRLIEEDISKRQDTNLIRNDKNLGYFGALNIGLQSGLNNINLCIVGNNDITFDENFLSNLSKLEYEDDVLVLAPNIITNDGFHQNPHYVRKLSRFRKAGYWIYFSNYYLGKILFWIVQKLKKSRSTQRLEYWNHRQIIYMGIGACYVLTKNFFRFYNRLDDRVFLWGEEALLAGQVSAVDGKILYDPSIVVNHDESGTVLKIPSRKIYEITKESHRIYSRYL